MANFFQTLGLLIEDDLLVEFAPALVTFLTAIQNAKGDPLKMQLALMQLEANLVAAAPSAAADIIGQLSQQLLTKIQALQAQAQASLTPPVAASTLKVL